MIRLDPSRELAWRHLGYKKHGNHWVKSEEATAERLEAERQKHADSHWKSRLEKLHAGLLSPHAASREKAEQGLAEITDPRAVPMVWNVLATGGERSQLAAVKVLGQIEGPHASNSLATLAVFSPSEEVRRQAIAALTSRDPRDVVGRLINLVARPFKFTVRPGSGPGSTGELFVDGERFDVRRLYRFPTIDLRLIPVNMSTPITASTFGYSRLSLSSSPSAGMPMTMGPAGMNVAQLQQAIAAQSRNVPATTIRPGNSRGRAGRSIRESRGHRRIPVHHDGKLRGADGNDDVRGHDPDDPE